MRHLCPGVPHPAPVTPHPYVGGIPHPDRGLALTPRASSLPSPRVRRRREFVRGAMRDHVRTCVSAGAAAVPPQRGGARSVQPGRGGCRHPPPSPAELPGRCTAPAPASARPPPGPARGERHGTARPGEPRRAPARGPSATAAGRGGGAAEREEGRQSLGAGVAPCPDSPAGRPGPSPARGDALPVLRCPPPAPRRPPWFLPATRPLLVLLRCLPPVPDAARLELTQPAEPPVPGLVLVGLVLHTQSCSSCGYIPGAESLIYTQFMVYKVVFVFTGLCC